MSSVWFTPNRPGIRDLEKAYATAIDKFAERIRGKSRDEIQRAWKREFTVS